MAKGNCFKVAIGSLALSMAIAYPIVLSEEKEVFRNELVSLEDTTEESQRETTVNFFNLITVTENELVEPECEQVEIEEETEEEKVEEEVRVYTSVPLDFETQIAISKNCNKYGVDEALVFAIMYVESSFNSDALGDNGKSIGLMQIQKRWHEDRMERLGVRSLFDPVGNALVGTDYLAEILDKYPDLHLALMVYNQGEPSAQQSWMSGCWNSQYSCKVISYYNELNE